MVTHSSVLAWRIPWTEEPWGCKESDTECAFMYPKPQRWGCNPVGILVRTVGSAFSLCQVRTHRDGGHPQARKRVLTRNPP